ncbi:hypothetical protein Tco_1259343 [Tanacetum coccineum]
MLAPPVVVSKGSEQPTEPQPISSTAPQEILTQVATATASQPPKDPNTYRRTKRGQNTKVPQYGGSPKKVGDEAINEEMFDSVERAIITDASLDAVQDSSGPWHQETMGGAPAQTRSERVLEQPIEPPLSEGHTSGSGEGRMEHQFELMANIPITPHDSPLPGGYTPGSDKGRLKLQELMTMCINLSKQVLDLEKKKDAQAAEILRLKKRVKRLEIQRKSSTSQPRKRKYRQVESLDDDLDEEDASKQGRKNDKTNLMLHESDFDGFDDETVDAATTGVSTTSAPITTAGVAISTVEPRSPPTTTTVFDDEDVTMAMAQTLIKMKEEKAKKKGVAFKDVEDSSRPLKSITILQPVPSIDPKDKGKGILVEGEPVKKGYKKEKAAQEEVSMAAIYEEYDTIQASTDADALFAGKLEQEDKEQYTIEERAKFLAETITAQRKFRAAQRAAEIRSRPPTKTQLRNLMMAYLKNMGGYKYSQLKGKTYEEIQGLYEREQKFIQDFVPMDSEKEEKKSMDPESEGKKSKRLKRIIGSYVTQKSPKKPKVMKSIKNVTKKEAAEYEKEKEELRLSLKIISGDDRNVDAIDMYVYKLTRAYGSSSYHGDMQAFLRRLDRQDLNDLYSCGVHTLFMEGTSMEINMRVEKKYPLIKELLENMLNLQLEAEEESTMAFELIKFIKSMLEE